MKRDARRVAFHGDERLPQGMLTTQPLKPPAKKRYYAHITGEGSPLPDQLAIAANAIQQKLKAPVILLIQNGQDPYGELGDEVWIQFLDSRHELPKEPPVILLNSPGGYADAAYRLAQLFQRTCGGYKVLGPV